MKQCCIKYLKIPKNPPEKKKFKLTFCLAEFKIYLLLVQSSEQGSFVYILIMNSVIRLAEETAALVPRFELLKKKQSHCKSSNLIWPSDAVL